jgi:hypothetical protein
VYLSGSLNKQLIISLKLNTRKITTIAEFPGTDTCGEISLSRFNPAAKGIGLGHWGYSGEYGGGFDWLTLAGVTHELLSAQHPYHITSRGAVNSTGDKIYAAGFTQNPAESFVNLNHSDIFSLDIKTKAYSVIASESVGLGLTPGWLEPVYDGNRDLDTVTGDRVLKPINIPNK